jgi:hypothetical protein
MTQPAVFTVCNVAYLHKALVLADSLMNFDKIQLKIYVTDRKQLLGEIDSPAEIIWIEDVGVPNLSELAFKYDITEFSTALKPFLTLRLIESNNRVIFLDPDTCTYNSISPILRDLDECSIVLTPHYVHPHDESHPDSDVGMMRFGSFNLGFFAVRRSTDSLSFLRWWSDRCFRLCFFETQFGLSTDQKWVTIAPCFFQDIKISFNLGFNVAFWNVHERRLSPDSAGGYLVNEEFPLVFFHFSSFDEQRPELLTKRPLPGQSTSRADLLELSVPYQRLLEAKKRIAPPAPYGFDYLSDGSYISPTLRRAFACVAAELPAGHDPFDADGPVGDFARRNHLLERRRQDPYVSNSFGDIESHKRAFAAINFGMRLILRVLGPNRFANFSRLLVFLSSYRQNRALWKV